MVQEYQPRRFFRNAPNRLLQRYFDARKVLSEVDFGALTETQVEPIYQAWLKLSDDARKEMEQAILAGPCVRKALTCLRGQSEHVVEFAIGQQSGIRGHDRAVKLEHQTAVEIEPENRVVRFTRRVPHGRLDQSGITH